MTPIFSACFNVVGIEEFLRPFLLLPSCPRNINSFYSHQGAEMDKKDTPTSEGVISFTKKVQCCCGNLYLKIKHSKKSICGISIDLRNSDSCKRSCAEAMERLITLIFQNEFNPRSLINGMDICAVIRELEKVKCALVSKKEKIPSCAQAIAQVLRTLYD